MAQSPLLALSQLARRSGDRDGALRAIDRLFALPGGGPRRAGRSLVVVLRRAGARRRGSARGDAAAVSGGAPAVRRAADDARSRCAAVCASGGGAQQSPAFSSKVEAVRVDVLVTDNGQPVRGLGAGRLRDRSTTACRRPSTLVSFDEVPLNVILALDMSDSVAGDRLEQLRGAGGGLLAALKKGDQAALVAFSHAVQLGARLTTDVAVGAGGARRRAEHRPDGAGRRHLRRHHGRRVRRRPRRC